MSNALFPSLIGLTWDIKRTPQFSTIIQTSTSGREVRAANMLYPLDIWELVFDNLPEATDFATLIGFYKQRQGPYDSFLLTMPSDSAVTGQNLGTGNGSQTLFPLLRTMGGFAEFVENGNVSAVYKNGVVQAGGTYSVTSTAPGYANGITFNTAPANGVVVTADFTYSWRVRFKDDSNEFNNFVSKIWELKKIDLVQVKN